MKHLTNLILSATLIVALGISFVGTASPQPKKKSSGTLSSYVIPTPTPKRPNGQKDVLELKAAPIPNLRVAVIGLGMRGPGFVRTLSQIDGVTVTAICDVLPERTAKVNEMLEKMGKPKATEFSGDTNVWRKVTKLANVDLVLVITPWTSHALIGVQAMKDGKHVAIEVPSAMSMTEIWDLINTSEQTRKHCMQLENCVYDQFELTTLEMSQENLFGEILHAEGAYIHNLEPYWDWYWNNWRLEYNRTHRGDVYATHGMGPACQALNIHRGDKMTYLVAMETKAVSIPAFIRESDKDKPEDKKRSLEGFENGDHTTTLIKTEQGKTIEIQHNVATPRPYNRMYQLTGTKGFANKYPVEGYALVGSQLAGLNGEDVKNEPDIENLNGHDFVSDSLREVLMKKYEPRMYKELGDWARKIGGHGGMDALMLYRLCYCLKNGLPLDMDVYDLAEWCCLADLTASSLRNNSAPVEIPDFTRGSWDKLKKLMFYYID